jgi:ABC-type lipoprotein release transport system permease subunit
MLGTLKLGWRNIWRNRRRTLISMSAVGFGLTVVVVYGGLIAGMMSDAKNQLDVTGMGHVEITAPGWRARHNATALIEDPAAVMARLQAPAGSEIGSRMVMRGLASTAHGSEAVELHGVDWDDEKKLAEYVRTVRAGALPAQDDLKGILIGDALAKRLHLEVGGKLRVMLQRADGEMGAELFRVRGIYHSISPELAKRRVVVSRAAAESLFGAKGSHQIVIQLEHPQDADALAQQWRSQLGSGFEVLTYAQIMPIFKTLEDYIDSIILVASLFIYLLVGLGILNTMLMSVLERTREFGVMQALGTRPSGVLSVVLAESFWIATISVVFGLTLGLSATWYGSHTPIIDMSKSVGESVTMGGLVLGSVFKTHFSISESLASARYVYVMALLVGLYPAWRVSRIRPVEALRAK